MSPWSASQKQTGQWKSVQKIVKLSKQSKLTACICAMSASEYQLEEKSNYKEFESFLEKVNCEDLYQILPMGYWDVTYYEHCVWAGENEVSLEKKIHEILFPEIEFDYNEYCEKRGLNNSGGRKDKKWLNAKCDVQMLWSHINADNDVFITEDTIFLKSKKAKLIKLGSKKILTPNQFIREDIH